MYILALILERSFETKDWGLRRYQVVETRVSNTWLQTHCFWLHLIMHQYGLTGYIVLSGNGVSD